MLRVLFLIGTLTCTSCSLATSEGTPPSAAYCPVAVHPDQCTRDYLDTLTPPPCAQFYFHEVGEQEKSIDRNCRSWTDRI